MYEACSWLENEINGDAFGPSRLMESGNNIDMSLLDEDHVLKIFSTKKKAKKVKKDGYSRKKKSCVFKQCG